MKLPGSHEKKLTEMFSSLTEELSSVRVKQAILRADLDAMKTLVQRMK